MVERTETAMSGASEVKKKSVINPNSSPTALWGQPTRRARTFYENSSPESVAPVLISLFLRLAGEHVYAVVQRRPSTPMDRVNHNGLDVDSDADVDEGLEGVSRAGGEVGITKSPGRLPCTGTYSFHFVDMDGNDWEILSNRKGAATPGSSEKAICKEGTHGQGVSGASARTGSKGLGN